MIEDGKEGKRKANKERTLSGSSAEFGVSHWRVAAPGDSSWRRERAGRRSFRIASAELALVVWLVE